MPIKYKYPPMSLFTDTIYQPIKLAIDKESYLPKYYYWGLMEHKFSNFEINIKKPQKIWSKENLPTFFNKQIPRNGYVMPEVISVGKKAPSWNAKSIDGINYKLSDYNNKPTLFVFFSTFCGGCIAEIPKLNNLNKENNNLNVIGICFENDKDLLTKFITKHNIKYQILYNANENLKKRYNIKGFPVNYLVDKKGYIKYSILGNIMNLEKDVQNIINNK